jgi:parallel beta-helix repeat protein
MNKNLIRKGIVFYVIIILIGTCVISSMGSYIEKNNLYGPLSINSDGLILYVGGSGQGNYSKIQDAIDNSSDQDMIFVYDDSSPYNENIIIDKSIIIMGEDPDSTIIDGDSKQCTITINSSNVSFGGFTIINGNLSGIKLLNSEYCSIFFNFIDANKRYGISLIDSSENIILFNIIQGNDNGVKLSSNSNNNAIYENVFYNNYNGIFLEYSSDNNITFNEISHNEYGIKLYSKSKNNLIKLNLISNNTLGLLLGGTIFPTFVFNMLLDGSTNNRITKNNFIDNTQDAFFQNSRRNRWWRNYWNESKILPKVISGELFICRLQGIPPTAIEHHIPWIPRLDWRPALIPFDIL